MTNLYEESRTVQLQGFGDSPHVLEAYLLTPDIMAQSVDTASYLDGTSVTLPAQSAVLFVLE